MPLKTQKYSLFSKTTTITYNTFCVLYMLTITSLYGQCITLKWVDSELNTHLGFFTLSTISEYVYFNQDYKNNKVIRTAFFNKGVKEPFCQQDYNNDGFLIAEIKYNSNNQWTKELHSYHYQNDHHIVIDSIKHLVVGSGKTDTILDVEKWVFNNDNRLMAFYNSFGVDLEKNPSVFNPDSIFYCYDICGNCDRITSYTNGIKQEWVYEYLYHNRINSLCFAISIFPKDNSKASEHWIFNENNQLSEIRYFSEKIQIEYNKNKIKKYKLTNTFYDYQSHMLIGNTITLYKYNGQGDLIAVNSTVWVSGEYPEKKPTIISNQNISIKRYKNGLLQTGPDGKLIIYTYKN